MGKIMFLIVLVAFLQVASAIRCYVCNEETCKKDKKDWEEKECGGVPNFEGNDFVCLEKSYYINKEKDIKGTQRKCVSAEIKDGKPVFNCPNTNGEVYLCNVCQKDLCNAAPIAKLSNYATIASLAVALLMTNFF